MTSPDVCTCGTVHMDSCPGLLRVCIEPGFVLDWTYRLVNRFTGADQDWPAGTSARLRFSWGTGTELIIPATIDGPYLRIHMTADETEQIPRSALVTIDVNYDNDDPALWRPWRAGRVAQCH